MIDRLRSMYHITKENYTRQVEGLINAHTFNRQIYLPDLGIVDKTCSIPWCTAQPLCGPSNRQVRCSIAFQEIIDKEAKEVSDHGGKSCGKKTVDTLKRLFLKCVPYATKYIFIGNNSPLRLLHVNDYVMEKAFVHGCLLLSKFMGKELLPCGQYVWPPQFLGEVTAAPVQAVVDVETTASRQAEPSAPAGSRRTLPGSFSDHGRAPSCSKVMPPCEG